MIQILLTILFAVLLPLAAGHLLAQAAGLYTRRSVSALLFRYLTGTLFSWAVFEAFAIVAVEAEWSLDTLTLCWGAGILAVLVFCIIFGRRKQREPVQRGARDALSRAEILQIVALLVILAFVLGWQIWKCVAFTYLNADDAVFLTPAMDALKTNTLFRFDADTGEFLASHFGTGRLRDIISPWQLYLAAVAKLTGVHPTILAHTVLPPFLLLAGYAAYWLTADVLFRADLRAKILFVIFAGEILTFFGGETRTQGVAVLIRIWQGKSVVAAVVLPAVFFLLLLWKEKKEVRIGVLAMLFVTDLAACLLSATGVMTVPILVGILGIVFAVQERRADELMKLIFSCTPSLVCAILNLVL